MEEESYLASDNVTPLLLQTVARTAREIPLRVENAIQILVQSMDAGQGGLTGHPAPNSVKQELKEETELALSQVRITVVETVGARILG